MFGAFRYGETVGCNQPKDTFASRPEARPIARDHGRTACDLCRAQKLKCSGDRDTCDRCYSSSSSCTYTLSSGTSAGKVRVRKSGGPSWCSKSPSTTRRQRKAGAPGKAALKNGRNSNATTFTLLSVEAVMTETLTSGDEPHESTPTVSDDSFEPETSIGEFAYLPIVPIPLDSSEAALTTQILSDKHTIDPPSGPHVVGEAENTPASDPRTEFQWASMPPSASPFFPSESVSKTAVFLESGENCLCLTAAVRLLEDLGRQRGSVEETAVAVDGLLICLSTGIRAFEDLLACPTCTTCTSHPTLFASIGQQLVTIHHALFMTLVKGHELNSACGTTGGESCHGHMTIDGTSLVDDTIYQVRSGGLDGLTVWLGRYKIGSTAVQLRLMLLVTSLHSDDLYRLLGRLRDRVRSSAGPTAIMLEVENQLRVARIRMQELEKISSRRAGSRMAGVTLEYHDMVDN